MDPQKCFGVKYKERQFICYQSTLVHASVLFADYLGVPLSEISPFVTEMGENRARVEVDISPAREVRK